MSLEESKTIDADSKEKTWGKQDQKEIKKLIANFYGEGSSEKK